MNTISLPEFEGFDWDKGNFQKNWISHEVTAKEAEQVFFNTPLLITDDLKHSKTEKRYMVLGQTDEARLIFMVFTMRKNNLRVISARDMSKKERKYYTQ